MQRGLSLVELAQKIEANKGAKKDFVAGTSKMAIVPRREVSIDTDKIIDVPYLEVAEHGQFPILPLAHDQIANRVDIPTKYYRRMLAEQPQLLATNVNTWFRENPERRMVRTLAGNTRAFLSNKYQRIENEQIAEIALPVLADLPGVQIVSSEVTDRRLHIQFVVPGVQGEVKVGDVVQAGGAITNSEVGLGAYGISGLIWRLACLNGMKTADMFRRTHVGRSVDEGELEWADDTMAADDRTVLLKVRDMVKAVVDETRFRANLDKMRGLTEGRITGNPVEAVEILAQKLPVTEGEKGGILRSLIEGGDLSAWGMLNAVTAQAHIASSYDRAVELEAVGGQLLELPHAEWKRVLEAE
jgi:hypothetical protein